MSKKKPVSVLCVIDPSHIGHLVALTLNPFEVVSAYTKAEALKIAISARFDLFIFDYDLPDGDGLDLCALVRTFDYCTPIVLLTSSPQVTKSQITAAGAQGLVLKDGLPSELLSTTSKILGQDRVPFF